MKDKSPQDFRFQFDDDGPDTYHQTEMHDNRVEKLSHKVTIVSFLFPLLLLIVLGVAYLDIKNRVNRTQNSGAQGVETLTKNLESRFSSLSIQNAKLEETLTKLQESLTQKALTMDEIIGEFEKTDTSLKDAIRKVYNDLNADLNTVRAVKIDKKETTLALSNIDARLAALGKDVKAFRAEIKAIDLKIKAIDSGIKAIDKVATDLKSLDSDLQILDKKFTKDIVKISTTVDKDRKEQKKLSQMVSGQKTALEDLTGSSTSAGKDIAELKAGVSEISTGKMDKQLMELILKKHQQNFKMVLGQTADKIEEKLESLKKRINELDRISKLLVEQKNSAENTMTSNKPPKPNLKSTKKATKKPEVPKPGNIIEQDIKQ